MRLPRIALIVTLFCQGGTLFPVQAPDAREPASHAGRFEVLVLGVAQDGGVPHLGCDKSCCTPYRQRGERLYPTSLGIHDTRTGKLLLVEATAEIDAQVALLKELTGTGDRGRTPVDGIILTHAHIGHYIGLAQLGREVASSKALPVYVSSRLASFIRDNGPWSQLVELEQIEIRVIKDGVPFEPIEGLTVVPVAVPHRDEFSDTMAFRFLGKEGHVLFVPDVDSWARHPELLPSLLEEVKVAYVDATFYDGRELPGRNIDEIPHPLMVDTVARLQNWVRDNPHTLQFIHLNHTNPALHEDSIKIDLSRQGFDIARRGDRVPF